MAKHTTGWHSINSYVLTLTERELWVLLEEEKARVPRRASYVERIHQRASKLRMLREREEIMGEKK